MTADTRGAPDGRSVLDHPRRSHVVMCECGDTWRGPCPRCQTRIDTAIDLRDHPPGDRADAAENRHDTYTLGDTA